MFGSIMFFIFIPLFMGYFIVSRWKELTNLVEVLFISYGVGLGLFCIISIVFNLFHIPLFYTLYFLIASILLRFSKFKKLNKPDKFDYIALLIMLGTMIVMLIGAYAYPYLEDSDPWQHAESSKYISIKMTAYQGDNHFHYIDPYPPSYDILMGVIHQLNDSIFHTLKILNALLIGFGVMFFYYFSKVFLKDKKKAVYATAIISLTPCFMSHFIWSQTLAVILMFIAWYCIEKGKIYTSILMVAAIYVTQPSVALIFSVMVGIIFLVRNRFDSMNYIYIVYIILGGLVVCLLWYGVMFNGYGVKGTYLGMGSAPDIFINKTSDTSDGLVYYPLDFIIARPHTKIDQPTGLGVPIFFLLMFGLYLIWDKKLYKEKWVRITLFWLLFTFIGIEGNLFPFKLFPHRFWVFFAIPVAYICCISIDYLVKDKKSLIFLFLIILALSGVIRIQTQTTQWTTHCGVDCVNETIEMAENLSNYPKNTYINSSDRRIIGFDMCNKRWCKNERT